MRLFITTNLFIILLLVMAINFKISDVCGKTMTKEMGEQSSWFRYLDSDYWISDFFYQNNQKIDIKNYVLLECSWTGMGGNYGYIFIDLDKNVAGARSGIFFGNSQWYGKKINNMEVENLKLKLNVLSNRNNIYDGTNSRVKDGRIYRIRYYHNRILKNQFGIYHLALNEEDNLMKKERMQNIEIIQYIIGLVEK